MASNCKTVRAEIEEAAVGAWLSRRTQEHVGACAACSGFLSERDSLRRLVGGLERVEAPGDFEFRLRARMAAAQAASRARFFNFRPAAGFASFALAAVLVASAAAAYYSKRPAPTADQASSSSQTPVAAETAPQQSSPAGLRVAAAKQGGNEVFESEDKETGVVPPLKVEKTAGPRQPRQERRRATVARVAAEPRAEVAKARSEGELEFGLSTSPVVKGSNVKLEVSSEPMRVVLRDERGTARRLPMNPVSFGAQSPVGKRRGPTPINAADNEGVW